MSEDKTKIRQQYSAENVLEKLRHRKPPKEQIRVGEAAFCFGMHCVIREVYKDHVIVQHGNNRLNVPISELQRSLLINDKKYEDAKAEEAEEII